MTGSASAVHHETSETKFHYLASLVSALAIASTNAHRSNGEDVREPIRSRTTVGILQPFDQMPTHFCRGGRHESQPQT